MAGAGKNVASVHRLTPTQEGILYHATAAQEDAPVYLQQFTCTLRASGGVDLERLDAAWQSVVDRHPALRTQLNWQRREHPLQVVRETVRAPIRWIEARDDFEAFVRADRGRAVDLERAPTHRVAVQPQGGGARMLWTFHHALLDGWSMRIVLDDLCAAYAGKALGPAAPVHGAYVDWILERASEPDAALAFWRGALAGVDARCALAWRPAEGQPATVERVLAPDRTAELIGLARDARVTLSTVLRVAWAAVLSRHVGARDVVFGTTVSGRSAAVPGIEQGVGMFVSTVPVRVQLDGDGTLGEHLSRAQSHAVDAVEHEWLPLARIRSEATDVPEGELFDALLVVENHAERDAPGPLELTDRRFIEQSHYGVALLAIPGSELEFVCVVDGSTADAAGGARLLGDMQRALGAMTELGLGASVDAVLRATEDAGEREASAAAMRGPASTGAHASDVLESVLGAGARSPGAVALASEAETVTYAELSDRAAGFAAWLDGQGVARGDVVLLALPRGADAICAMLGCLMAGAAYAPIPCDAGPERVARMQRSVDARLVVRSVPRGGSALPQQRVEGDELAYVLFTSGTTGEPKGVEITRDALARSNQARFTHYGGRGPQAFLLVSPLHFDSSVAGIWWTLAAGGTLVLPSEEEGRDPSALVGLAQRFGVTHTLLLPSLWRALCEPMAEAKVPLEVAVVAGEACPPSLVHEHERVLPGVRLENEYGPTEATVWATAARLEGGEAVTIGRPVGDVLAAVFDSAGRPAPTGVAGELCLAGPTLARGYAGDPALDATRFVTREWPDGEARRTYRTGDRARLLASGQFESLGRMDGQVKVRGQRIELEAVEAALLELPGVRGAAAVLFGPLKQLGAAVVRDSGSSEPFDVDAAREALRKALPAAAVPTRVVPVDELPRARTGKVDRRAVREGLETGGAAERSLGRPLTDTEAQIAPLWIDVLGVPEVGPDDDFFALGGDSLASIRLLARAHRAGLVVDAREFGDNPTVAGMARAAQARASTALPRSTAPDQAPPTPIQRWFLALDLPERNHWNLAAWVDGLTPDVTRDAAARALAELVAAHDALRLWVTGAGALAAPMDGGSAPLVLEVQPGEDPGPAARALRESFQLDAPGPLVGALLVRESGARTRIALLAHHFAVDALSLDALTELLRARLTGSLDRVPAGPSFVAWAAALEAARGAAGIDSIREAWRAVLADAGASALFGGRSAGAVADEFDVVVALDPETTRAVVEDAHGTFRTERRDALVLALARALADHAPHAATVPIEMESHGRGALDFSAGQAFDLAGAVGWFTATYPVFVPTSVLRGASLERAIQDTKELLRAVPGGGQSFGLLGLEAPKREVLLNDLGHQALDPAHGVPALGALRATSGGRAYALEVNVWIEGGVLRARFSSAPPALEKSVAESIARAFESGLRSFAETCANPGQGARATPSDFPLAGLDQAQLDRLADQLGEG